MSKLITILFVVVLVAGIGGLAWVAVSPIAPATETVTGSIPDARIAR